MKKMSIISLSLLAATFFYAPGEADISQTPCSTINPEALAEDPLHPKLVEWLEEINQIPFQIISLKRNIKNANEKIREIQNLRQRAFAGDEKVEIIRGLQERSREEADLIMTRRSDKVTLDELESRAVLLNRLIKHAESLDEEENKKYPTYFFIGMNFNAEYDSAKEKLTLQCGGPMPMPVPQETGHIIDLTSLKSLARTWPENVKKITLNSCVLEENGILLAKFIFQLIKNGSQYNVMCHCDCGATCPGICPAACVPPTALPMPGHANCLRLTPQPLYLPA